MWFSLRDHLLSHMIPITITDLERPCAAYQTQAKGGDARRPVFMGQRSIG